MIILRREEDRKHRLRKVNESQNDTDDVEMIPEAAWSKECRWPVESGKDRRLFLTKSPEKNSAMLAPWF